MKNAYGTMYYVDDMSSSVAFYKAALGIAPAQESNEWTEFAIGEHRLCLHKKEQGKPYTPNGILILQVKEVKTLFENMKVQDFNVFGLHEVHPGAWTFHIKDKSQNEVSFYGEP